MVQSWLCFLRVVPRHSQLPLLCPYSGHENGPPDTGLQSLHYFSLFCSILDLARPGKFYDSLLCLFNIEYVDFWLIVLILENEIYQKVKNIYYFDQKTTL